MEAGGKGKGWEFGDGEQGTLDRDLLPSTREENN